MVQKFLWMAISNRHDFSHLKMLRCAIRYCTIVAVEAQHFVFEKKKEKTKAVERACTSTNKRDWWWDMWYGEGFQYLEEIRECSN